MKIFYVIFCKVDDYFDKKYGANKKEAIATWCCIWLMVLVSILAVWVECLLPVDNIWRRIVPFLLALSCAVPIAVLRFISKMNRPN